MKAFLDYLQPHFPPHLPLLPFTYLPLQLNRGVCPVSFPLSIFFPLPGEPLLYVLLVKSCLFSAPQLKGFSMTRVIVSLLGPISPSAGCRGHLAPLLRHFPNSAGLCACVYPLQWDKTFPRASTAWFVYMLPGLGLCPTQRRAGGCFLALKGADGLENLTLQEKNQTVPTC